MATTAGHDQQISALSEIQKFYSGTTVFLTGGTGFLGKLAIEKLLRTCSGLKRIYVLVRPKKGKQIEKRFEEIFECLLFDGLKRKNSNFESQVFLIAGDCAEPDLGLCNDDRQKLIDEVDCVIHCAATVRFDEKLRTAVNINVRATRDLLMMARQMKQLKSFVHISSAFAYCPQEEIDEVFYDSTVISGKKLMAIVESLDDATLNAITPTLLGKWPNTYVFTKAVAEEVVKVEGKGLPLAIIRPSIVLTTIREPVPGWIDNFYGPSGILAGVALGIIRTLQADSNKLSDMVPADYVINFILAAGWHVANSRILNQDSAQPSVYNYVSSTYEKITWGDFHRLAEKYAKELPSPLVVWHYCFIISRTRLMHVIFAFLLHTIPAYVADSVLFCIGHKTLAVKGYRKVNKFTNLIAYFATREWRFHDHNTRGLWKKLTEEDKKLFSFDLSALSFEKCMKIGVMGGRVYLLKDPLETIPRGRAKTKKLMVAHYTLCAVFGCLLFLLFSLIVDWRLF